MIKLGEEADTLFWGMHHNRGLPLYEQCPAVDGHDKGAGCPRRLTISPFVSRRWPASDLTADVLYDMTTPLLDTINLRLALSDCDCTLGKSASDENATIANDIDIVSSTIFIYIHAGKSRRYIVRRRARRCIWF